MTTSAEPLPPAVLKRKAVVYVRQSTQTQVQTNLESKRRQYDLVDVARAKGFGDVELIDDDLGRSGSGTVARPGFERLVAALCAGEVGAVLCLNASRLARNGRDWHHLLELCGLVQARVIDLDGIYDPCRPNDRLLLGMKGSISEFELGVLRTRMLDAARAKAAGCEALGGRARSRLRGSSLRVPEAADPCERACRSGSRRRRAVGLRPSPRADRASPWHRWCHTITHYNTRIVAFAASRYQGSPITSARNCSCVSESVVGEPGADQQTLP